MTVMKVWSANKLYEEVEAGITVPESTRSYLIQGICVNSTAFIDKSQGKPQHVGSKTECALLDFVEHMGDSYEELRKVRKK
jgi:Ca2+ transporting ATPase